MRLVAVFLLAGFIVNAAVTASLWKWAELWRWHVKSSAWSEEEPVYAFQKTERFGTERWIAMPFLDPEENRFAAARSRLPLHREGLVDAMFGTGLAPCLTAEAAQACDAQSAFLELQAWGWPLYSARMTMMRPYHGTYLFDYYEIYAQLRPVFARSKDFIAYRRLEMFRSLVPSPDPVGMKSADRTSHAAPRIVAAGVILNTFFYAAILAVLAAWLRVLIVLLRWMRPRHRVVSGGGLLVFSILTTWLVSWFCTLLAKPAPNGWWPGGAQASGGLSASDKQPYVLWSLTEHNVRGAKAISSRWYDQNLMIFLSGYTAPDPPRSIMPWWWGDFLQPPVPGSQNHLHERFGQAWGWPFLAMWNGWLYDNVNDRKGGKWDSSIAGLPFPNIPGKPSQTSYNTDPMLPLGIIWPGFALNVIIYFWAWATLFMAIALPIYGRRHYRLARGRCTHCAYDLRATTADRCPECGTTTPPRKAC